MISVSDFYTNLQENGISFFTGVPDSLLKDFCAYLEDHAQTNIITANEGAAVALAAGNYMATGKPALVYMQNSGIGNAVNPLLSLVDEDVYKIPVLLVIGWRGEPGVKDEPQHVKQGKTTLTLLECMGIDYIILDNESIIKDIVEKALTVLKQNKPFAIVVRKNSFEKYKLINLKNDISSLERERAIEIVTSKIERDSLVVSTTGKISRELFEIREKLNLGHDKDFLTVGSMGHASQIALGIALSETKKSIYCFDGDGAALMHLGNLTVNAAMKLQNFKHIVFNNASHDSVGGQPTIAGDISLSKIALECGYSSACTVDNETDLKTAIQDMVQNRLQLLEIRVKKGSRDDLGRPTVSPQNCKKMFMDSI